MNALSSGLSHAVPYPALTFLGDIMPGRFMLPLIERLSMAEILSSLSPVIHDRAVVANLECPLFDGNCSRDSKIRFQAPTGTASQIRRVGFTGLSIANNHIFDCGAEGAASTRQALEANGLFCIGAGRNIDEAQRPAILDCGGTTVGIAAFSYTPAASENTAGVAPMYGDAVERVITALRPQVDFLVAQFHSGVELLRYPLPRDRTLYRRAVDLGANLVIGSHAHCVQVMEHRHGTPIYYSLGDCLFDHHRPEVWQGFWKQGTHPFRYSLDAKPDLPRTSLAVTVDFSGSGPVIAHRPVRLGDDGIPFLPDEAAQTQWLESYESLCANWQTSDAIREQTQAIEDDILESLKRRRLA